jgi:demethylmenaquinone methyltransferase/2-methoxy-6-polyprenyl-1,4-benzoquinol methylase
MQKARGEGSSAPDRVQPSVPDMFDRIAPTYDLLNHVLSLGHDFLWRRRAVARLDRRAPLHVLDLATGTGDLLIALLRRQANVCRAVGLDASEKMLAVCRRKLRRPGLEARVELVQGEASATPFADNTFDAVTMAFGIRNTSDVTAALGEIHRILKPEGQAVILEFSLPSSHMIRWVYLGYLRHVVPRLGALISGDRGAYRYLNASIEAFHQPEAFSAVLREAGFGQVTARPLTMGVASLYSGYKASEHV